MNAAQRKTLEEVSCDLQNAMSELETERDAEQDKYDNMPESFQNGDKGEKMQEGIDALEEAIEGIQAAIDALCNIS